MTDSPLTHRSRTLRSWIWLVPAAALAVAACADDPLPTEPVLETDLPALTASVQDAGVGADDWIVVFKDGTKDPPGLARKLTTDHGGSVRFTYQHVLKGFAGRIPPQAIEGIRHNPNVDFVAPDGIVTKAVESWGLDRIDQRSLPLDNAFVPGGTGANVDAWILDSGIDYGRTDEFGSRIDTDRDRDFIDNDFDGSDCEGHGTHVAGTVGSTSYGVAKGVTLISVRVLGCDGSGSYSAVIAGIDYVAGNMSGATVANMSLTGPTYGPLNTAVKNAVGAGVVMAVAAGNDGVDACTRSPASAPEAITVGATMSNDARSNHPGWWASNYGSCVDLFAPGSAITSTIMDGGSAAYYGTSMASPHVAGAAALLLEANPGMSATEVWAAMQADATAGVISDVQGSPNLLLHVGSGGDPPPPPDPGSAYVQWISDVSVATRKGGRASGTVTVQIVDENNAPLSGATVNGSWNLNLGDNYRTSSGTTGADGLVEFSTGNIKNATTFEFCVTSLSATNYEDLSNGECGPFGEPVGVEPPPPPPAADAPTDLAATKVQKGKNHRVELTWNAGGPTVDVKLNTATIATVSNSGSYTHNVGKTPSGSFAYQVCNAGTDECTLIVTVNY